MNRVLIVDASASDGRIMAGLLTRAGYDPVVTDCIEAGKVEVAKLPPGAVVVTAMLLPDGTAREFINWLKTEGFSFPVIAIVENLNNADIVSIIVAVEPLMLYNVRQSTSNLLKPSSSMSKRRTRHSPLANT